MADNQRGSNNALKIMKKGALPGLFLASTMMLAGCVPEERTGSAPYTDFINAVNTGRVESAQLQGQTLVYTTTTGGSFQTFVPENENVADVVRDRNVRLSALPRPQPSMFESMIGFMLPIVLILGLWMFISRKMMGGAAGGGGMSKFGASKAKLLTEVQGRVTFADVASIEE
ncbi:MAG: cell division protein FtsH, partial [Alphaproteobacteria bacterium]|nr:cell division protein FtsH [Alphaproteobacteria bacterium]